MMGKVWVSRVKVGAKPRLGVWEQQEGSLEASVAPGKLAIDCKGPSCLFKLRIPNIHPCPPHLAYLDCVCSHCWGPLLPL